MISVGLRDGLTGRNAQVSTRGQLITAPLEFSKFYSVTAAVINTGYNLIAPRKGMCFIITDIVLSSDRNVGANGALVVLYEATAPDTASVSATIYSDEIAKQTKATLIGLNIIVSSGKWVNVKTDDNSVLANVAGYYVSNGDCSVDV